MVVLTISGIKKDAKKGKKFKDVASKKSSEAKGNECNFLMVLFIYLLKYCKCEKTSHKGYL